VRTPCRKTEIEKRRRGSLKKDWYERGRADSEEIKEVNERSQ